MNEQDFENFVSRSDKLPNYEKIKEWEKHRPTTVLSAIRKLHFRVLKHDFEDGELVLTHGEIKKIFDIKIPEYITLRVFKSQKRYISNLVFELCDTYNKTECCELFRLNNPSRILALYGFGRRTISSALWSLMWISKLYNQTSVKLLNSIKLKSEDEPKTDDTPNVNRRLDKLESMFSSILNKLDEKL